MSGAEVSLPGRREVVAGALALSALATARAQPPAAAPGGNDEALNVARARYQGAIRSGDSDAASDALARTLTLAEASIRAARQPYDPGAMRARIAGLMAEARTAYSLAATHPEDQRFARLALLAATIFKARLQREEFAAAGARALALAEAPAPRARLDAAQAALTAAAFQPVTTGEAPDRATVLQLLRDVQALRRAVAEVDPLQFQAAAAARIGDIALDMGLDQITASMNFGRAAIIYVRYEPAPPSLEKEAQFLAIVVHANTPKVAAPLVATPLGSAEAIETTARAFRRAVALPTRDPSGPARELYRRILAPLEAALNAPVGGVQYGLSEVSICADGALLQTPFSALMKGDAYFDPAPLSYIDSPIDLALIGARRNPDPATLFTAVANPDFRWITDGPPRLEPLPEAEAEARTIASLWPAAAVQLVFGAAATASRLRAVAPATGILHIATHGELVYDPLTSRVAGQALDPAGSEGLEAGEIAVSAESRSLILLTPELGAAGPGLMSALEVSTLDLSHTQLVVLAACETGLGDYENGQEVHGLRQAFVAAGAETVVSSLWDVFSGPTSELMVAFHRALFQHQTRSGALRLAMRYTRSKYGHPCYWAPFIMTGSCALGVTLPPPGSA